MGAFDKLQRAADARNGDTRALDSLAAAVTEAVRRYKSTPTTKNYCRIMEAMVILRRVEGKLPDDV